MTIPIPPNVAMNLAATFVGERIVPGGANLVHGNLMQAGAHLALGVAARAAFGLPGLALVSADSIVKAMTGENLYTYLGLKFPTLSFGGPHVPPIPPSTAAGHATAADA